MYLKIFNDSEDQDLPKWIHRDTKMPFPVFLIN